jgi:DNA (cytosine-5)-methyltransferase 1
MAKKYTLLSLFTGCGGLDLGFRGDFSFLGKKYARRNFEIVWANDINPDACETFRNNFDEEIVCGDLRTILEGKVSGKSVPGKVDVVLGGFPCQDFSHAGKRLGFDSKRGVLYQSMAEVVRRTKPLVFMAENVRGLLTMNNGRVIETIKRDFGKLGYHVEHKLLLAADYGVPQNRERVIIIGTKKSVLPPFEYPKPSVDEAHRVNLKAALGDLEGLKAGEVANHFWSCAKMNNGQGNSTVSASKPGPTMRAEHHGNIEWHWNGKRRLSAREAARIQSFPDDFIFYPSTSAAYRQIGNAVPPVLGWHLASAVQQFLDKHLRNKGIKNDSCHRGRGALLKV